MRRFSAACLCAILFSMILTAWVQARWPLSILEVGSFGLALAWLIHPKLHWTMLPPAFVALWGALQIALHRTIAVAATEHAVLTWAAYFALTFAALQTFEDDATLDWFLNALLWFSVLLAVISTLQAFTSRDRVFWIFPAPNPVFLMGPFPYHTHFANLVELVLPLALIAAITDPARRVIHCLQAAVLVAAVVASASRGGFALVVIETICVLVITSRRERRVAPAFAIFAVLAAALAVLVGWETLLHRYFEEPYYGRWQMFQSSLAMIRDHPLFGVGLGNWSAAYPAYALYDDGFFANQAHNDWAQWTAEGGSPVLTAMLYWFFLAVRQSLRRPWCLGVMFVFLHAAYDYPFQKPAIAALVFVMLAAAAREPATSYRDSR